MPGPHPRAARYPCRSFRLGRSTPFHPPHRLTQRLQILDGRADVVRRHRGLYVGIHPGYPFTIFAPGRRSTPQVLSRPSARSPLEGDLRSVQPAEGGADLLLPVRRSVAVETAGPERTARRGRREVRVSPPSPARPSTAFPPIPRIRRRGAITINGPACSEWPDPHRPCRRFMIAARPVRLHPEGWSPCRGSCPSSPEIRR